MSGTSAECRRTALATSNSSSCLVCCFPIIPGALPVCQACKKFYRRCCSSPRNKNSLRCSTGTNQCQVEASNNRWRLSCRRCRLDRCVEIGIGNYFRRVVSLERVENNSSPHLTSSLIVSSNSPSSRAENALGQIVRAALNLSASLSTLPMRQSDCNRSFSSELDAWTNWMDNFEKFSAFATIFVKQMPGFDELPVIVKSSQTIFAELWLPFVLVEANRLTPLPFGISLDNANELAKFLPETELFRQYCWNLCSVLSKWHPSLTELACLFAVLYINGFRSSVSVSQQHYNNIKDVVETCLFHGCGGGVESARRRQLHYVEKMALEAINYRNGLSWQLRTERPHLFSSSPTFFIEYDFQCHNAAFPYQSDSR